MLVRGRTLVKGEQFNSWRSIGHALQAAKVHAMRGVDELMILDISATAEGRGPDLKMVEELSAGCFIPITVGGGVRSLKDIDALLRAGADKVAVCSHAAKYPEFIQEAASRFGNQAIVVGLDVLNGKAAWTNCATGITGRMKNGEKWGAVDWAKRFQNEGAGEILLSCVERDGMMQGYDLDLIREVSQAVSIPVIASGGCGSYEHMLEAFKAGADACAAGAIFAFSDATPKGAAMYLKNNGLEVRL
jgi:cyclase